MNRYILIITILASTACGSQPVVETASEPLTTASGNSQPQQDAPQPAAPSTESQAAQPQPAPVVPEPAASPTPMPTPTPLATPTPAPTPCEQIDPATGKPNYLCGTWSSGSLISSPTVCSHFHGALFQATRQADGTYMNGHYPLIVDVSGSVSWQIETGTIWLEAGPRGVWIPDQTIRSQAGAFPCYFDMYPDGT